MSDAIQALIAWVSANPDWVYLLVFSVAFLESLAIVGGLVPGVSVLLAVAGLIGAGQVSLWPALGSAVVGAVLGDQCSFWLGRRYRAKLWTLWPLSKNPSLVVHSRQFFAKHGGKSIVIGRFIGPIRAIVPAMAGMSQMSPGYFSVMNLLSALAWAPAYLLPGVAFGHYLHDAQYSLFVILAVAAFGVLITLWLYKKAGREPEIQPQQQTKQKPAQAEAKPADD